MFAIKLAPQAAGFEDSLLHGLVVNVFASGRVRQCRMQYVSDTFAE